MGANERRTRLQSLERMLQITRANRRGSDHQRAVGNCLGQSFVFFGAFQYLCCAYGGTSPLKCYIVGIHHPQMLESEIAHRPSGCADVQGIARVHQDHAEAIEFSGNGQASCILRQS